MHEYYQKSKDKIRKEMDGYLHSSGWKPKKYFKNPIDWFSRNLGLL